MSFAREGADYIGIAEAQPSLASAGDYLARRVNRRLRHR